MRGNRFARGAAAVAAVSLVLGACGGDDDAADEPSDVSAPESTAPPSSPSVTSEPASSEPSSEETTETTTAPVETVDVVTIGLVDDFSGAQGPFAEYHLAGLQQLIDQVNGAGGIASLGGAQLEIEKYDTETDPNNAAPQTTRAIDDGVDVIMGGLISDSVIAGTNISARAGVPWITSGAVSVDITSRGYDNVFQFTANTDQLGESFAGVADWACGQLGCSDVPTMGLSWVDATFGNTWHEGFQAASYEFDVLDEVSYPFDMADLSPIAARMTSQNPETLVNLGYPAHGLQFGRLFSTTFETDAKVLLSGGSYAIALDELGDLANGMILSSDASTLFNGMPDVFLEQNQIYSDAHGEEMHYMAVRAYTVGSMLVQALEAAGSTDGAAIAAALHDVELTHDQGNLYPQATMSFDDTGALNDAPQFFVQIQDGAAVGIYPTDIATGEVIAYR